MPAIATNAIKAASKPYSSRSWPSVSRARRRIATLTRSMVSTFRNGEQSCPKPLPPAIALSDALRRRRKRGRDLAEDHVHVRAGEADGPDAHERDERDQQRVLEEVLSFFLSNTIEHARHPSSHVCTSNLHRNDGLRRGRERGGNLAEDHVDVRAGQTDGADADERDQGDEQRVLEKVLAFVVVHERS